jgi:Uma2 family endonuclease
MPKTLDVPKRLFTVEEYHRMAAAGVLREDDRVELIEGEIVEMSPIGNAHAVVVKRLNRWFHRNTGDRTLVGVQDPIRVGDHSEPQPDVMLLRPQKDDYAGGHPGPEDVFLAVEVADTSLTYDHDIKIPFYARAGIAEAWLVDIPGKVIEVHRTPGPDGYADVRRVPAGQSVSPLSFPDATLPVDELFRGLSPM